MNRKFVVNLFFLIGLNLLIKPFWIFGIDRTVQNVVGENIYGLYFTLFNFTVVFNCILDFGINNFNNRSVSMSKNFLDENFSRILTLKLLLGIVYFVIVLLAGLFAHYKGFAFYLLILLAFNQFLSYFILYLRSNISGLFFFKTDSFISVADRFIMIVLCGILLWGHVIDQPFQIEWFVYCQTFAYLLTIVIALPIVLSHTKLSSPFVDWKYFKKILIQSLPFALLALITSLHNRMDAVFLERLLPEDVGSAQSGIYASAFRLLDAANMISYLFSVILLPVFSNMLSKHENIKDVLKTAFSLIFVYGLLLAATSFFYSDDLMTLLYDNHVKESAQVFRVLMISILPLSATYVFGSLLTARGELKKLNYIALIALAINASLNLLLIFRLQAVGSAIASLTTQCFIVVAEIILVSKIFDIRFSGRYVFKTMFFTILSVVLLLLSTYSPLSCWWNILIALSLSTITACLMGMVNLQPIFALLKEKLQKNS